MSGNEPLVRFVPVFHDAVVRRHVLGAGFLVDIRPEARRGGYQPPKSRWLDRALASL